VNRQSYLDKITLLSVAYGDEMPMKPTDADFGLTIDFEKGKSDPIKVFEAMAMMLNSFRQIDQIALDQLGPNLEPLLVLEDVEAGSMTSWVRTTLKRMDDQAIKEFDPKQLIGAYVVKAKYKIIEYLDKKDERDGRQRLETLAEDLTKLGMEVPGNQHLLPPKIEPKALVAPLNQIQEAKSLLGPNDKMIVHAQGQKKEVNTKATEPVTVTETITQIQRREGEFDRTLLVKKPDYLGNSKWDLRDDKRAISAHILDSEWLRDFHNGEVILQPGSSLRCTVRYRADHDERGNEISSEYEVTRVHETIDPSGDMLDDLFKIEP